MLLTESTSFGIPKVEAQTLPDRPRADPRTIIEACKRPNSQNWIEAANVEWEKLLAHDAFDWVDPPQGSQIIASSMVLKKKMTSTKTLRNTKLDYAREEINKRKKTKKNNSAQSHDSTSCDYSSQRH